MKMSVKTARRTRILFANATQIFVSFSFAAGCAVVSGLDDFSVSGTDAGGAAGTTGSGVTTSTSGAGGNATSSSSTSSSSTTTSSSSSASSSSSSSSSSSASSSGGVQQTVSFGEAATATYSGVTTDTTLDQTAANANFGSRDIVNIDMSPLRVGLLRFDLSALPTTTQVISAELHLRIGGNNASAGTTAELFAVLESWVEGTNDGMPGVANWQQRMTNVMWMGAGATPPSRATTVLGTFQPTKANTDYVVPLNAAGLAIVANWVSNPSSNNGFAIPPSGAGWAFESSESASTRPLLVLTVIK